MSHVSCKDVAIIVIDPGEFPVLLHHLLSESTYNCSMMWLAGGRAMVITDKVKICANVCPLIIHTNRYKVFIEWIEKYGFRQARLDNGHDTEPLAVFYHEVK